MSELLLIGAGHTHVQVLRAHAMRPFPARITLVVDDPVAVYSGMVPGLVEGRYAAHELQIDARALARRARCRVIHAEALRVDARLRRVHVEGRPSLGYDVASLNIGSTVAGADVPGVREHALASRPIGRLVGELDARCAGLPAAPSVVVVGAGAGGVELAFCLDSRLRASGRVPSVTLVFAGDAPLGDRAAAVGDRVVRAAARRGIRLLAGRRAEAVDAGSLTLDGGEVLPADLVVWVAGAAGPPLARDSGLPVDGRGFVRVGDDLRVEGEDALFAAGDCAVLGSWPEIPKAGVYAVREGPVLVENLRAALEGRPLTAYRPQSDYFGILNLGDGTALGAKWGVPVEGRWVMAWKDRIDRAFMRRFQVLDAEGGPNVAFDLPAMADDGMVCGGCAAKAGQDPLARALARLPTAPVDERVVLGVAEADDVVAWRHGGGLVVQNLDAFPAFTDDPWLVGRCAAINALSDVFARGARPAFALALVVLPTGDDAEEALFQVMAGVRDALDGARVALLGGHTSVGPELMVGLAVTAHADGLPWSLGGARPGDALVLGRALGTGVLLHADRAGRAPGRAVQAAFAAMQVGNGPAAAALEGARVSAVTDVTGFGLAGHLAALMRGAGRSARLTLSALPALDGVLPLLRAGERSTFHAQNRERIRGMVVHPDAARDPRLELCFDPQTCGGLLVATPDPADALRRLGPGAAVIGEVLPARPDGAFAEVVP